MTFKPKHFQTNAFYWQNTTKHLTQQRICALSGSKIVERKVGSEDLALIYGSHRLGGTQWGIKVPCACLVITQTLIMCGGVHSSAVQCWCFKARQLFREAKVLGLVLFTSCYHELHYFTFYGMINLSVINYDVNSSTWLAYDKHVADFRQYIKA